MAYSVKEKESILNTIFDIIESGKSLRYALLQIPLSSKTFYEWIEQDEEKVKQYAHACEKRADAIFEDIIDIADDSSNDFVLTDIGDGITVEKFNSEHVQRSRLKVDARKWMLSKMNPKKYGDKLQQEHSGEIKTNTTIKWGNNEISI